MNEYFYTDGVEKYGPFLKKELANQNINRNTKIWYSGLNQWTELYKVEDLKDIINEIPPDIGIEENTESSINNDNVEKTTSKQKNTKLPERFLILLSGLILFTLIIRNWDFNEEKTDILYNEISLNSYNSDEDFSLYVEKFYRDLEYFGIYPKKPQITIIKFSRLDQMDKTTHIHGLSFGGNDDDRIEIYINPSTWKKFNKPLRYYLMYHELAHDVLNLDDLDVNNSNKGNLMYPEISSYESITMDDFIESSHALFEEVAK
mgnify:CR=1 FL=1